MLTILGQQTYTSTSDFASALQLNPVNMWGIVKTILGLLMEEKPGYYVLARDPNLPNLKLYGVPEGFDVEEELNEAPHESEE